MKLNVKVDLSVDVSITKECTECHEVKPLDAFHKHPQGKFGRDSKCKACKESVRAMKNARYKAVNETLSMADLWARTPDKKCCKCKHTLPSTLFDRNNAKKSGLDTICHECNTVARAEIRERNIRINSIISIDELRRRTPKRRCYKCEQTLPSIMFDRDNSLKSGLKNICRECGAVAVELHRKANPEIHRARGARYRAKKLGLFLEDFTYEQIVERDGVEACGYCHTTEGPFEVDHIFPLNLEGWHTPDNLVLACVNHNRSKGAVHPAIYVAREDLTPNESILRALTLEDELTRPSTKEAV